MCRLFVILFGMVTVSTTTYTVSPHIRTDNPCTYTPWSPWSGECPSINACGGGIQTRKRAATDNTETCMDTIRQKICDQNCVHVLATKGLMVIGIRDNTASTEEEDHHSPVVREAVRYTYGSLSNCSLGCHDIGGLDRDHDIVCVMCTNSYSCKRAGTLHMNKMGKLDFVRRKREGPYMVRTDGMPCSCSFTPKFPLMAGMCSAPSYYISVTVL